jgi:DNA/RNA-binding domain of Phe-tRNA-synthetase-like protein
VALYDEWAESYDDTLNESGYATPDRCAEALAQFAPDPERRCSISAAARAVGRGAAAPRASPRIDGHRSVGGHAGGGRKARALPPT